ncbi:hypothetical protein [Flagellimonas sp.]|uniref:hypothetical protein n=1 Tax=Flagellimonas sp. TaxID=2058762 RepID=UPI003B52AB34
MKKLNKAQRLIFLLGIIGTLVGLYGKFNGWEHNDYFPIFYSGMSFMWIAFLPSGKTCCNWFKKRTKSVEA